MKDLRRTLALLALLTTCSATLLAQPEPYPANAEILAIVTEINADSIFNAVTRLQAFHTRHTYSTTEPNDIGIGEAVRWIQSKTLANTETSRWNFLWFDYTRAWQGEQRERYNIIVWTDGEAEERGRYIIGGHLDSRTVDGNDVESFAPGADDNASSCAALLELIRVIDPYSFDHDLQVAFFTGEEQGLWGSEAYGQDLAGDDMRVDAMICMDMIGRITDQNGVVDSNRVRLYAQGLASQGGSASSSRNLQRYLKWVGEAYADSLELDIIPATDRPGRGSDHISFSEAGYPSVRVIEQGEDTHYQHDSTDIVERITPSYARRVARAAVGSLITMLRAPLRPDSLEVEQLGVGRLRITIPEEIGLPAGGSFFVSVRRWSHEYFDEVVDLGDAREYVYESTEDNADLAFSLSRTNADGLPSPFSQEVVRTVDLGVERPQRAAVPELHFSATPNPFNASVTIRFEMESLGAVSLSIYDVLGREVETLMNEQRFVGAYEYTWQPDHLAGGIYFARFRAPGHDLVQKLVYLK